MNLWITTLPHLWNLPLLEFLAWTSSYHHIDCKQRTLILSTCTCTVDNCTFHDISSRMSRFLFQVSHTHILAHVTYLCTHTRHILMYTHTCTHIRHNAHVHTVGVFIHISNTHCDCLLNTSWLWLVCNIHWTDTDKYCVLILCACLVRALIGRV